MPCAGSGAQLQTAPGDPQPRLLPWFLSMDSDILNYVGISEMIGLDSELLPKKELGRNLQGG